MAVKLVDIPLDSGDPNRAIADINEAITQSRSQPITESTTQQTRSSSTTSDINDPRFAGKSTAEIVDMYRNLESHSGRLASQLGEARQSVSQLILGKRENDLRQGSGQQPVNLQPADLMVNPTEALDRYFASRANPEVTTLKERLSQLEAQLQQNVFTIKHPQAESTTQDPAFAAWVRQTPLRSRMAASAAQGNMGDADLLLTEWQTAKMDNTDPASTAGNRAQDLARRVSLESSNTSSESGTGQRGTGAGKKKFRQSDLIALRMTNPDKYEDPQLQAEIMQAYVEGRVIKDLG